ncbi:MAG: hypothetical protein Q4F49_01430 [Pseudoxanthomonas suwonensis]|nr:hypothetical protein [Pseudoxanthomonas suwonensis]
MTGIPHWLQPSLAMGRSLRRSLLAVLLCFPAGIIAGFVRGSTTPDDVLPRVLAIVPYLAVMVWILWTYLRFLRECDELERRIELLAMVWGGFALMLGAVLLLALMTMQLLAMPDGEATILSLMAAMLGGYGLARLYLMWHYR